MNRKKRLFFVPSLLLCLVLLCAACSDLQRAQAPLFSDAGSKADPVPQQNSRSAPEQKKLQGIWVSYLELAPMLKSRTAAGFEAAFRAAMKQVVHTGLNTVFLQVRPFGDALYPSDYYPWSHIASGTRGKSPGFDPLAIMLRVTKEFGLSAHAWINPYRISASADSFALPADDPVAFRKDVCTVDGGRYLNPASADARALITNGVTELLTNYSALDGIHLDDYFYPTKAASFDAAEYQAYKKSGGQQSLADFRRTQVTLLIRQLFSAVKTQNPAARLGISPAGNLKNVTDSCFLDVNALLQEELVDYLCPQIYFGFSNQTQPFLTVLAQWEALCDGTDCLLYVGLPLYKSGKTDRWAGSGADEFLSPHVLSRMTRHLLRDEKAAGLVYYALGTLQAPDNDIAKIELVNCRGLLS